MVEFSNVTDYRNIKFDKNYKADYKAGNPVVNCIFKQFDEDMNGSFLLENGELNTKEWTNYENYLKKKDERNKKNEKLKNDNEVLQHYNSELVRLYNEQDENIEKFNNLNIDEIFDELLNFEEKYQVERVGYLKKEELPKDAYKYDITYFEMGIYNEQEKRFTGECYEKGYLKGFENLSIDKQKEYLELLDKTSGECRKSFVLNKELDKILEKIDKNLALQDLTANGYIKTVGSSEFEDQMYEQYKSIRSDANPFYKEIKELERKIHNLHLKGEPTDEDFVLLQKYINDLNQLNEATLNWSISETGVLIQPYEDKLTMTPSADGTLRIEEGSNVVSSTLSGSVRYKDPNFNLDGNVALTTRYNTDSNNKYDRAFNMGANLGYKRKDFGLISSSSLNLDDSMISYNQNLNLNYKEFSIDVNEHISRNIETLSSKNVYMTSIGLNYTNENINARLATDLVNSDITYSISASGNYNESIKNYNLSLSPSMSANYNTSAETYSLNPAINVGVNYYKNNLSLGLNLNESQSIMFAHSNMNYFNNNFGANFNVNYKNVNGSIQYNNNFSKSQTMNTYGVSVGFDLEKAGNLSLNYSCNQVLAENENSQNTHLVTLKYSLPLVCDRKK